MAAISMNALRKAAIQLQAKGRVCIVYIPKSMQFGVESLLNFVKIADCRHGPRPMRGEIGRAEIFRFIVTREVDDWVMHLEADEEGRQMVDREHGLMTFATHWLKQDAAAG